MVVGARCNTAGVIAVKNASSLSVLRGQPNDRAESVDAALVRLPGNATPEEGGVIRTSAGYAGVTGSLLVRQRKGAVDIGAAVGVEECGTAEAFFAGKERGGPGNVIFITRVGLKRTTR